MADIEVSMNDLSRGMQHDRDALIRAATLVIDSGYAIHGAQHAAFERELADYLEVSDAVGVASGTDALELAIKAVMPDGRDVVVTAGNAGAYTSTATVRAGYTPRYADVDPDSLCLTAATVAPVLDARVGVVVVTHLYGRMTDLSELRSLCDASGTALIEDCAQAIGAGTPGRRAGSVGHAGTLSFYPTKNLGAIGDGGAVVTTSPEIAARLRQLRQYGWGSKYNATISGGVNSRLDEMQAAFLRVRLPQVDGLNARRREIIARYAAAAANVDPDVMSVLTALDDGHTGHLAAARSTDREAVRARLRAHGVASDVHFPIPDWEQPAFAEYAPSTPLPETVRACSQVFSLPLFPELREDEIAAVCDAIRSLA
ncbi:DegT/DnrJ/EryC1/StrS family aminotransferase [Microbacterium rhizomatis]|nr:DegT/DnrJ/EryC1/StrS family aminotransferase [Microbacterium rhizomatis]